MRLIYILLLVVSLGCSKAPHRSAGPAASAPSSTDETVRNWLATNSYVVTGDHLTSDQRYLPWNEWIGQGKKIGGLEEVLIELLHHDDAAVDKRLVMKALGDLGTRKCVPELIGALDSEDIMVQIEAANALGRLAGPEAVVPLRHRLSTERDANVRANILAALERIEQPKAGYGTNFLP